MKPLRPWYVIIANTAILICVLQVASYGVLRAYYYTIARGPATLSEAEMRNYAHMTADEFADFAAADLRLRFRLELRVGLLPDQLTSRFINIDAYGIRANGPTPRPITALDGAIWFLGGSTAFGDGIADHETVPAQLERLTGRPVINMGVQGFSSALENGVLVYHLRAGYRPSLAVFFDGINETCEPDLYDVETRELFHRAQQPYYWDVGGPFGALVTRALSRATRMAGLAQPGTPQEYACAQNGREFPLSEFHARIMGERRALCDAYRIDCRTVVQPFAGTHGPSAELPRAFLDGDANILREVYFHLEPSWKAAGAVFVTDALDNYPGHPFIDETHYSADASRVIAEVIARRLGLK